MILNEKVMNTKVVELMKIYNIYFVIFSFYKVFGSKNFEFSKMTSSN